MNPTEDLMVVDDGLRTVAKVLEAAEALKELGRDFFQKGDFQKAFDQYKEAYDLIFKEANKKAEKAQQNTGECSGSEKSINDETVGSISDDENEKASMQQTTQTRINFLGLDQGMQELAKAIVLNLSIVLTKLDRWGEAASFIEEAYHMDPSKTKTLFWRSQILFSAGDWQAAEMDNKIVLEREPGNVKARNLQQEINKKKQDQRKKEQAAYANIFDAGLSLYADKKVHPKTEVETAGKTEKPEDAIEEEKSSQENRNETNKKAKESAPRLRPESGLSMDLDEEDEKILNEVKNMGYTYFNKNKKNSVTPSQTIAGTRAAGKNEKEESIEGPSSWNKAGTTFEEKEKSNWAHGALKKHLEATTTTSKGDQRWEDIANTASKIISAMSRMDDSNSRTEMANALASILNVTIKSKSDADVTGEAHIAIARGKLKYIFDLSATMPISVCVSVPEDQHTGGLTGALSNMLEPRTYAGNVTIQDLLSCDAPSDWLKHIQVGLSEAVTPWHSRAVQGALDEFKQRIIDSVEAFQTEFHQQK